MTVEHVSELLGRRFDGGSRITNCVAHLALKFDARPDDCHLCLTDLRNQFNYALRVNEWLNKWKTDAEWLLSKELP